MRMRGVRPPSRELVRVRVRVRGLCVCECELQSASADASAVARFVNARMQVRDVHVQMQVRCKCELRGVHGSARCAVWVRAAFFFFFFSLFSFFFASAEAGPGRSCRCLLLRCCSSSFLSLLLFFSAAPSDWGVLIFACIAARVGGHARHIRARWPTAGSWVGALLLNASLKRRFSLISGGVVECEKGWRVSLSLRGLLSMRSSVACSLASLACVPLAGSTSVDQASRNALDRAPGTITCWESVPTYRRSRPKAARPHMRNTNMGPGTIY